MATATSAELLDFMKDMSGLPTTNDEMTDAKWFRLATLAQAELFRMIVAHVPSSQFGAPELLTSSDGGYTYQFATFPWGRAEVRASRTGILLHPGAEYDSTADFVIEGQTIRWVDKRIRTFDDGPYARYAREPGDVDAATQPTLQPASARVYIAWEALAMWASRGRLRDPSFYRAHVQRGLWGDPHQSGHTGLIPALKTQFLFQGGRDGPSSDYRWWQSPDLGAHYIR